MISYNQLIKVLESFADAHDQIKRFGAEFKEQLPNISTDGVAFPYLFVVPVNTASLEFVKQIDVEIYCIDRLRKDRENTNDVVSDCEQILTDLAVWLEGEQTDVDVVKSYTATPLNNDTLDYVAGWFQRFSFELEKIGECEIPMSEVAPIPVCEVANYTVQYEDGTLIESGTIPSGGSKLIEVPNVITCAVANWTLTNSLGNVLDSGTIASGGSETIIAPDANIFINSAPIVSVGSGRNTDINVLNTNFDQVGAIVGNHVIIETSAITANGDALVSLPATTALDVEVVDTLGAAASTSIVAGKVQVNDLPCALPFPYEGAQFIIDPNNANYFLSPNGLSLVGDATYQTFNSTPYVSPFLTFNGVDQYAELTALKFHEGMEESLSFHAWVEIDYSLTGPFPLILPTSFSSGNGAFYIFWDGFSKNLALRGYNSSNALTSYLLGDVLDGFTNTAVLISLVHDFNAQETKVYRNGILFSTTGSIDLKFSYGNLIRRIARVGGLYSNHKQGLTAMYSKKHTTEALTIFNLTKSTYGY